MMPDGYDGPMNGTMRGFPLVKCERHGIWHRSNLGCIACELQAENTQLRAHMVAALENNNGGGNGAKSAV